MLKTSQLSPAFATLGSILTALKETVERPGEKGTRYATQSCDFVGRIIQCEHPFVGQDEQLAFSSTVEHLQREERAAHLLAESRIIA